MNRLDKTLWGILQTVVIARIIRKIIPSANIFISPFANSVVLSPWYLPRIRLKGYVIRPSKSRIRPNRYSIEIKIVVGFKELRHILPRGYLKG